MVNDHRSRLQDFEGRLASTPFLVRAAAQLVRPLLKGRDKCQERPVTVGFQGILCRISFGTLTVDARSELALSQVP